MIFTTDLDLSRMSADGTLTANGNKILYKVITFSFIITSSDFYWFDAPFYSTFIECFFFNLKGRISNRESSYGLSGSLTKNGLDPVYITADVDSKAPSLRVKWQNISHFKDFYKSINYITDEDANQQRRIFAIRRIREWQRGCCKCDTHERKS